MNCAHCRRPLLSEYWEVRKPKWKAARPVCSLACLSRLLRLSNKEFGGVAPPKMRSAS